MHKKAFKINLTKKSFLAYFIMQKINMKGVYLNELFVALIKAFFVECLCLMNLMGFVTNTLDICKFNWNEGIKALIFFYR